MAESNQAFVRTAILPAQKPPLTEMGVIKWLRENLFSGWFNTILTLVGLWAIYSLIAAALPWWLNGVWNAGSLGECRAIVAERAGPDATGACWAMVRDRWHQFMFGLYPQDQYWRPTVALGLLFAAIAPVLFSGQKRFQIYMLIGVAAFLAVTLWLATVPMLPVALTALLMLALLAFAQLRPASLIWFTVIYPALAFFLLWGGSVWTPVAAMAGLLVLLLAYRVLLPWTGVAIAAGIGVVLALLWWALLDVPVARMLTSVLPFGLESVASDRFGGFLLALTIGVTAISFSLPMGILLALGRQSDMVLIKTLSVGFIEFIRGVPLITLLFTASLLLQYFLPPNTNFDLILRVIILVTFFAAAYIAEVIRGGLAALPRGQYEAADALGLDYWSAQRLIIMPQALKIAIPGIVSTFIGLFKDTTLVAFVGLLDPLKGITQIVRADIAWKGIYWEPYIFVGAIFFVICFGMSRYSMYLEQKLKRDHR
ncbi:MAG: amino acid ABC transporter permease [Rhodobacter sp.]|nr:amino acid ABC transporter permease [Rhodobacter sp.]